MDKDYQHWLIYVFLTEVTLISDVLGIKLNFCLLYKDQKRLINQIHCEGFLNKCLKLKKISITED